MITYFTKVIQSSNWIEKEQYSCFFTSWKFTKMIWSGHEGFSRSEWDQRKKTIEFHPCWCSVGFCFLDMNYLISCILLERFVYDSLIKKLNTYIVLSQSRRILSMTEVFLYYFVKCNFPFCFQTQDLWCISVLVIMYDLLHDFSFAKHVLNSYRFYSQTVFIYLIYMVFSWTPCLLSEMMALKHSPFFSLMRVSR